MTVISLDRRSTGDDAPASRAGPSNILLVFPNFNPHSFWSFKETCKIVGAKYPAPPLGLITLAGMLPADWNLRLVNCNCTPLTDADIEWADLVMTGGMLPQQLDCLRIMARCRALGTPVAIGGPDPTSSPHVYAEAEFLVLGEAEGIIDTFIAAWRRGDRAGRFDAEKFQADITKSPIPRYDLLDFKHYLYIGLQFSRGCPFNCEFCDIIELYGRVPRTKTTPQVLAELDRLLELGYRGHVDFVDDNLIGNKKALKKFLPELKAWQVAHQYPFKFSTEASINLADDDDLLAMLAQCNFFACFIGIESGDTETLVSMQKKQNTRRSLSESIFKIYNAGIYVVAGFIVGFDTEKNHVSEGMIKLIEDTSIPVCTVGLLTALPNTQLTRRLDKEGRLFEGFDRPPPNAADACTAGLNFTTLRPRREIMADFRTVVDEIYTPQAFFARLTAVAKALRKPPLERPPQTNHAQVRQDLRLLRRMVIRLCLRRPSMAIPFWKLFIWTVRNNPAALEPVMMNVMIYMHVGPFSRHVVREADWQITSMDRGQQPEKLVRSVEIAAAEAA